jgi:hypothetical protein
MITFIHKKHADKAKGKGKIVITYTGFEIVLGLLLLFTNVSAMILIYNYGVKPVNNYQNPAGYQMGMPMMSNVKK